MTVAELIALLQHADPFKPVVIEGRTVGMIRMDPEESDVNIELSEGRA